MATVYSNNIFLHQFLSYVLDCFYKEDYGDTQFEFNCFETYPISGVITTSLIFLPGVPFSIMFSYSLRKSPCKACLAFFFTLPFFPVILCIVKLISLFQHGAEWQRIEKLVTACETQIESLLQAAFQFYLYYLLQKLGREPSLIQIVSITVSMLSIALNQIQTGLARRKVGDIIQDGRQLLFISVMSSSFTGKSIFSICASSVCNRLTKHFGFTQLVGQ